MSFKVETSTDHRIEIMRIAFMFQTSLSSEEKLNLYKRMVALIEDPGTEDAQKKLEEVRKVIS